MEPSELDHLLRAAGNTEPQIKARIERLHTDSELPGSGK